MTASESLPLVALGFALCEAERGVREEGGENRGPRIEEYLRATDPPISVAAPWCAAFVQFVSDRAAEALAVANPLDAVRLEALVQSYADWSEGLGLFVERGAARPGDLVIYRFPRVPRWNHIGILASRVDRDGSFSAVEGNTNDAGSREGDGVVLKLRSTEAGYPTAFIRWG